jgi:hypothetical protein
MKYKPGELLTYNVYDLAGNLIRDHNVQIIRGNKVGNLNLYEVKIINDETIIEDVVEEFLNRIH